MALTTLPYPSMDFVPLDILTAEEMNQLVANIEAINNATIGTNQITDNAITTAKLNDSAVTSSKIDWTTLPIKSHTTATTSGLLNVTWQVRELYDGTKIYDGFGYGNWWFGANRWISDAYITLPVQFVPESMSLSVVATAADAACQVYVGGQIDHVTNLPLYRKNSYGADITTTVRAHVHLVVYAK